MIWRYDIRKVSEGFYSQSEYMLMSGETSRNLATDLYRDHLPSEAVYFDARAKEGTQFVLLASDSGYSAFARLPRRARKHVKPGDRKRVARGQTVSVYACIY